MNFKKVIAVAFALQMIFLPGAFGCTGIIIKTENGISIPARTMEFGFDIRSKILAIPKGITLKFLSPIENKDGYTMTTKYGFAGMNAVEKNARQQGLASLFVLTTVSAHWFQEQGFIEQPIAKLPAGKQEMYNFQRKSKVFIKGI